MMSGHVDMYKSKKWISVTALTVNEEMLGLNTNSTNSLAWNDYLCSRIDLGLGVS